MGKNGRVTVGARGEGTIRTGGREVRVLFTNRALANAEVRLQRSVLGIAQGFGKGEAGITETVALLQVGMEAARREERSGGRSVSMDDAYQVLDEAGFTVVAGVVMEAVAAVLSYNGSTDGVLEAGFEEEGDPN